MKLGILEERKDHPILLRERERERESERERERERVNIGKRLRCCFEVAFYTDN